MGLAFPLGLLAAALAGPLILLYVLKLRRREVVVASTLPWRRVLEDRRASSPWEKLRRNLLLLLQLLALLLLVLAFAGPYLRAQTALTGDTVLVLDVSASMGAKLPGTSRTRMDDAKTLLRDALLSVEGGRRAALVLAGPEPRVAAPLLGERAPLQRALDGASVTGAPADLLAALELAQSLARGAAGAEIVLVTDGSFERTPALEMQLATVRVIGVGVHGEAEAINAGITSLALRPVAGEAGVHELFAGVQAQGMGSAPLDLTVEAAQPKLRADGAPDDPASWSWSPLAREVVVPDASGASSQLVRVAAATGAVLRIRVGGAEGDALATDDEALLVVPERPRRRILLASPHPFLLERALTSLANVEVDTVAGDPGSGEGYDAVVIDGPLPALLPARPLLQFGAPAAQAAPIADPHVLRWNERHPALRHARFDAVRVASAWDGPLPPGGDVVLESDRGALAVAWPAPGGRALAFRFDLTDSDLPLRVTFPVLVADAIDWLTEGAEQDGVLAAGRPRDLIAIGVEHATLVMPDGERRELQSRGGALALPALPEPGLLAILPAGESAVPRLLACALLSPEESDLRARGIDGLKGQGPAMAAPGTTVPGRRMLWPWAAALAVAVLVAEWAVHHRRRE